MPQTRVLAALIIVAIAAVLATANSLQLASQLAPDPYSVEATVERFAVAADRLSPDGPVGYISDLRGQDSTTAFLSARYALAPRLLTPVAQAQPQQAIGNFSRPRNYAEAGLKVGYTLDADLGNGVVLYSKAK
jgi:hypothetical protein